MPVDLAADQPGGARFTRGAFIVGSLGLAASVAGVHPGRLRGSATAATAVDGCGWVPWEMGADLSRTDFSAKHAALTAEGYRLVRISGYATASTPLVTAIWELRPAADHVFELDLSRGQFKHRDRAYQASGYRLIAVDGFGLDGVAHYSGIWERAGGAVEFELGLTARAFADKMAEHAGAGYRLLDVSGFGLEGRARFAALWRKDGPAGTADIEMSEADFSAKLESLANDGLAPFDVSAYPVGGETRYAAIWTELAVPMEVETLLGSPALGLESDARRYRGQRPVMVDAYPRDGRNAYATVWRRDGVSLADEDALVAAVEGPDGYMAKHSVPGLSLAFAKNGKLVYARSFGYADPPDDLQPVTIHSRFQIASTSKPITAVAIMRLIQDGRLTLGDPVFGPESRLLGTRYGMTPWGSVDWDDPDATGKMPSVTVQHLLEHTAGWPNNASPNPMNLPRRTASADPATAESTPLTSGSSSLLLDREGLIHYVVYNSTARKTYAPQDLGRTWRYSGFGYLLLTKIVEIVSGVSYEEYVERHVVDDADCTLEMADRDGPLDNEVSSGQAVFSNWEVWRRAGGGGWVASAIDLVRFMTRVDRDRTRRDAISSPVLERMLSPSTANEEQGLGWALDPTCYVELPVAGPASGSVGPVDYWHGGSLPGSSSVLACATRGRDRYCWAAVANANVQGSSPIRDTCATDPPEPYDPAGNVDGTDLNDPMRYWFSLVQTWPCLDLF